MEASNLGTSSREADSTPTLDTPQSELAVRSNLSVDLLN